MGIMVRNIFSIYTQLTTTQSACAERCQSKSKSFYHETRIALFREHYNRHHYLLLLLLLLLLRSDRRERAAT